jgi:hypothetical protein
MGSKAWLQCREKCTNSNADSPQIALLGKLFLAAGDEMVCIIDL